MCPNQALVDGNLCSGFFIIFFKKKINNLSKSWILFAYTRIWYSYTHIGQLPNRNLSLIPFRYFNRIVSKGFSYDKKFQGLTLFFKKVLFLSRELWLYHNRRPYSHKLTGSIWHSKVFFQTDLNLNSFPCNN